MKDERQVHQKPFKVGFVLLIPMQFLSAYYLGRLLKEAGNMINGFILSAQDDSKPHFVRYVSFCWKHWFLNCHFGWSVPI